MQQTAPEAISGASNRFINHLKEKAVSIKPEQVLAQVQAQSAALAKAQLEALQQVFSASLTGAERLAALNLETVRTATETAVGTVKSLTAVKDAQELAGLGATLAQPTVEKLVGYGRGVYDIATQTQSAIAKVAEAQVAELSKQVTQAIEKSLESAPAGSEPAVSAIKSVIAGAHTAYEAINKAAKDVAQMTEANVAAATDATIKAVSAATPKLKRVA